MACKERFYARSAPVALASYAHCAKCGSFELQKLARVPARNRTVQKLMQLLGVAAYRCAPCRRNFFSMFPLLQSRSEQDSEAAEL